ncbi:MAG: hypothetical protein JKY09_01955 [Crocinitomicaceae bacterium]|nr:hypothetical protein [Crocinitomicaceae bacterium]
MEFTVGIALILIIFASYGMPFIVFRGKLNAVSLIWLGYVFYIIICVIYVFLQEQFNLDNLDNNFHESIALSIFISFPIMPIATIVLSLVCYFFSRKSDKREGI